jgi:ribonuclease E
VAQLPSESEEAALPPEEGTAPGTPRAPVDGGQVNEVGTGERRRRRRGRRGGRRRRGRGEGEGRAPAGERSEARQPRDGRRPGRDEPGERSRKRGSRGGGRQRKGGAVSVEFIPGDDDELPELADLPGDAVLVGAERTEEEDLGESLDRPEPARSAPHKHRVILVNARDSEETRVAVVEDGRIVDLQMTVRNNVSYVNDIYRGRVVNLETAIGAAFVDFGEGRNGFLHASDVMASYGDPDWSLEKLLSTPVEGEEEESEPEAEGPEGQGSEPADGQGGERPAGPEKSRPVRHGGARMRARVRLPIERLLKKGQMVAVQITKDAIGDKGPTLTTYVSIPGRYLVLMPSLERTGVSRKIDDERERRRLKRILVSLDIPEGMGVIVRTAGIGRTKTEIKRDLDYLLLAWDEFSKRLKSGRNPAPLYQESDVAIRTMRDLFTPETEAVIVDDPQVFQRMIEFTKRLMPEHLERVTLHEGARPLFHSHGVEQDFEKIFARRVELPSGGSIVIEQTEALVAIDVNSGRTREAGAEFEDIALKTNLEAAPEIARQIRLRDLGGIIVLDYIDMMRAGSRRAVERATREALKPDRARAKIGRISQFGLLELTRQRLGPGLSKLVYDTCPRCRGSGRRRNASSRAQAILRRLAAALALKGYTTVEVRAHPEVVEYLQKELKGELERLQQATGREIKLLSVPEQVEDSVLHYLRADGKEVRPGGRRRR